MNCLIKYPQRQDCGLKLSAGNSGETSINLATEIAQFLNEGKTFQGGEEIPISFKLYKEDFIKATCHIIDKLPLYKTSSTNSSEIIYSYAFFKEYIDSINKFFGDSDTAEYDVVLSAISYPRFYLKNLRSTTGFNIRKFLLEKNSKIEFSKENDKFVLRLISKELTEEEIDFNAIDVSSEVILSESVLAQFILKTITYISEHETLKAIECFSSNGPNIKVSSESYKFSLTGMFLESDIDDISQRNTPKIRWFEAPIFKLRDKDVFLSTQWNGSGNYQLTFDDFKRLIDTCYNNKYKVRINDSRVYELLTIKEVKETISNPSLPLQQIYYGAPGTGKSHIIHEMTSGENVIRTTFHPDSDYSTFVGCYKPTTKEEPRYTSYGEKAIAIKNEKGEVLTEDRIVYEFVDQAFLQAYVRAWKAYAEAGEEGAPTKQFLVIEEINRGNCAQIFGDLFQLLDRNAEGFSDYPIQADNDMRKHLKKAFDGLTIAQAEAINALYKGRNVAQEVMDGKILLLPNNLYIWATMNTSDQSLFPIDSAFKRRWDWQYMPICKGRDAKGEELQWAICAEGKRYDWWSFLEKINEQIGSTTNSEDKKLGYFFCKPFEGCISAETFVGKVVFYLWNDVFKDYGFDNTIFNDDEGGTLSFDKFYTTNHNGKVVVCEDKVVKFLENLGVEKVEYTSNYN